MYRPAIAEPSSFAPQPSYVGLVLEAAEGASRSIPPLWPLATSVAVNPFLGHAGRTLAQTSAWLALTGGAAATMPRSWYRERLARGEITEADLHAAWGAAPAAERPEDFDALMAQEATVEPTPLPTVADLAAEESGCDWPAIVADAIGGWAAAFFDQGQALWALPHGQSAYASWRTVALHDRTPEIHGLRGFRTLVAEAPDNARDVLAVSAARLGLRPMAVRLYFERLLMAMGGWSQFARFQRWQAELAGAADDTMVELLAIRLLWDQALLSLGTPAVQQRWAAAAEAYDAPVRPDRDQCIDAILQHAAERAEQRWLAGVLHDQALGQGGAAALSAQLVFCIDVRSEPMRRAIEQVAPGVRTSGFAGFFGLGTAHRPHAACAAEPRLPVLLRPALTSRDGGDAEGERLAQALARGDRAWGRFKQAAVSSFAFVEAAGLTYAVKLVKDALRLGTRAGPAAAPLFDPPLPLETRIDAAERVLRAMSLAEGMPPLLVLLGHAAHVTNNLHASALQCGACGGHSGAVNARLLAALLQDAAVRDGLAGRGIALPADLLVLAGEHDTTSDRITLFVDDVACAAAHPQVQALQRVLAQATVLAGTARAVRVPGASGPADLAMRGRDWAQVRPEWGLAGCSAFLAAPRGRSAGKALDGRCFLHDYDWRQDRDGSVLELILTAPVVVASWISLQYYGSSVAPGLFGAGNKLLHNAVGGVGVLEGNGGVLRGGLPWQSVHDGDALVHTPLRLTVCVEAPRDAITAVLARHEGVRALFDQRWLHLLAMDEGGRLAWRYAGGLAWVPAELDA